jgi:hypothetical protein
MRPLELSKTVLSAWTKLDSNSGLLIGQVEAMIRTSPEQIIAYLMHFDSSSDAPNGTRCSRCKMRSWSARICVR